MLVGHDESWSCLDFASSHMHTSAYATKKNYTNGIAQRVDFSVKKRIFFFSDWKRIFFVINNLGLISKYPIYVTFV